MVSQTPCSSQSRSRRQHVAGEGNSSGKSCQRAPLRRIHKMPSSTLRSSEGGRPPCGRLGRFGSKGRIFSHWASVSSRPYRAIGPPLTLLPECTSPFPQINHHPFSSLYPVLKQLLVRSVPFLLFCSSSFLCRRSGPQRSPAEPGGRSA